MIPPSCQLYLSWTFGNPEIVKVVQYTTVVIFTALKRRPTLVWDSMVYTLTRTFREMGKSSIIIIRTSDTDVIVLCVHFDKQMTHISDMLVQMRNIDSIKNGRNSLHMYQLCAFLSITFCKLLSSVYALTGCDRLCLK